jgi:glutathione S-transferase
MSYTLITANRNYSSWSLRPWLLMKALGIPFEDRVEPFTRPDNYDDFRAFSPTGQVPVLLARESGGERTVWDSLGITLYLADRHPEIWPQDKEARAFAQAVVAEMHGGFGALRNDCTMNVGVRVAPKPMSPALQRNVARVRELFEQALDRFGGPWLTGTAFTAADAFYAPVAFRIRTYGLEVGRGAAWVDHVIAHPAMQDWERQALAETWREESHEAELAAAGTTTADYRQGQGRGPSPQQA